MALHCWKCGGLCVSSVSSMCQRNFQIQEDESQLEGGTQQHIAIQGSLEWCIGLKQQKLLSFFPHRYVSCLRFFEKRRWVLSAALSNRGAFFRIRRLRERRMLQSFCQTLRCYGGVPLSRSFYQGRTLMRDMFFFSCHWSMKNWSTSAHVTRWVNWITWPSWNCSWSNVSGWFFWEKMHDFMVTIFSCFFFEDQTFPQLFGGGIFHDRQPLGRKHQHPARWSSHLHLSGLRCKKLRDFQKSLDTKRVVHEGNVRFLENYTKLHT